MSRNLMRFYIVKYYLQSENFRIICSRLGCYPIDLIIFEAWCCERRSGSESRGGPELENNHFQSGVQLLALCEIYVALPQWNICEAFETHVTGWVWILYLLQRSNSWLDTGLCSLDGCLKCCKCAPWAHKYGSKYSADLCWISVSRKDFTGNCRRQFLYSTPVHQMDTSGTSKTRGTVRYCLTKGIPKNKQ